MKKVIFIFLSVLFMVGSVFAQTGDDFEITQNEKGTITITRYTGSINDVVIPSTIEGIKVTEIGEQAFNGNKNITSVTIPNSVTIIKSRNGNYISGGAFGDCTKLTSIIIPNSVTSIGNCAFYGCSSLISITIPDSVTSIGKYAFYHCRKLVSVTFSPTSKVTSIGDCTFSDCVSLASITIPNSVIGIGDHVFSDCTSLANITISNSVTTIGRHVFDNCTSIVSITIGANKAYANLFPNNFAAFYESQGKKAGTYTWSGRLWSVK